MSNRILDSNEALEKTSAIWLALGEQIAAAIPIIIDDNADPVEAIRWAICAEACFAQATGECEQHNVKDALEAE